MGDICIRDVVVIRENESLRAAADLMRKYHVGAVIVVSGENGESKPVGIVTDRDLVLEVMAPDVNPDLLVVGDIMTTDLLTAKEEQELWEALEEMQDRGVRRVPVVNESGALVGIFTIDDMLDALSLELSNMVKLLAREQRHESVSRK